MQNKAETAIGVDVGGTRIRVARISADCRMLDRVIEPVRQDRAGFVAQLLRLINDLRDNACAVGIGIPGRVHGHSKNILSAGYLDIGDLDLAHEVSQGTGLPVRVENDATMALIAEGRSRPDCSAGLVFMVTIGTGIGGAALLDGAPWYGGGLAGQFGHIVVSADGEACKCGRRGCVETFSSGTALGRLIAEAGLPADLRAEALLARAEAGERHAQSLLADWAAPLQRALQSLVSVADPKLILVGGGLGREMTAALAGIPDESHWFRVPVDAARLGDTAGVIGAGLAALDLPDKREARVP
ncbi:ROK family protein [Roseinatronobacter alkalisoli]|uniref:ROK family protein n=1 Tax=Roseinatronobacter alkalisoli TaxID=3028235 RepID=A0ABT5TAM2_9RHOB|nr:ROK family protein [Roseinatronobacter sp. HJB301]MDD7972021.1 ROK family protein [Roseinatronobacter sp. HJB301]